jgi:acyl-CoA synthetase (AMP-forming)/AMP-acid ligase II
VSFLLRQPRKDAELYYAQGLWNGDTIPGLIRRRAAERPDHPAIIEPGRRLTYAQLAAGMERVAAQLAAAGVDRGDAVVVRVPDSAAFVAACAGAHAVQAVSVPVAWSAGESEIAAIVDRLRVGAYAGSPDSWPCLQNLFRVDFDDEAIWTPGAPPPAGYEPDPDALMEVMFTSGTTGRPKGVMNTANTKLAGLRGFMKAVSLGPDDVWGVAAPMAHQAGWAYSYLLALYSGATAVMVGRGDSRRMLDTLVAEGVTISFLVPTHAVDLVGTWRTNPDRWPLKLRIVLTGSAAVPPETVTAIREEWHADPALMYGMTEVQSNVFTRPGDPLSVHLNTVGRPCPDATVGLLSLADGRIITQERTPGEVVTRGPFVCMGYYDDQPATAAAFTKDGWFRSGDLAEWVGGNLRLVGRLKEIILRGGATIVPDDIEAALAGCPGVEQVSVCGLPDERLGEMVCACIVGTATLDDLLAHLRNRGVGRGLWPDAVVPFEAFPRTVTGKVQRGRLAALAAARRAG